MTIGMFDALLDRHLEGHRRRMLYAGVIAAEIWNANPFRKEGSPPVSPLDFVPKSRTEIAAAQSLDEQIRILTIAMGCGPEL